MDLNTYQNRALQTAIYPTTYRVIYPVLGLAGETGETCEKIKKLIRDDRFNPCDKYHNNIPQEKKDEIKKELGDCLWYLANLASDLGYTLNDVAKDNLSKLQSRQKRDQLGGSGDNR